MLSTALTYDPSQQELSLLVVIGGLTALLVLINLATGIWDRFRKKPSHTEDLASYQQKVDAMFARKSELSAAENRLSILISNAQADRRESLSKVEAEVAHLRQLLEQGFKELQRTVGRIEGKLEE